MFEIELTSESDCVESLGHEIGQIGGGFLSLFEPVEQTECDAGLSVHVVVVVIVMMVIEVVVDAIGF